MLPSLVLLLVYVHFVLFCFVFVFKYFSLKPRPFVLSLFDNMHAPRQPHAVTKQLPAAPSFQFFFLSFFRFFGDDIAFSEYFFTVFSLEEYVVYFFLPESGLDIGISF